MDFSCSFAIFSLVCAGFTLSPVVRAAHTDGEHPTQHADGIPFRMLFQKEIPQTWLREKMASAFFRCHAPDTKFPLPVVTGAIPLQQRADAHGQERLVLQLWQTPCTGALCHSEISCHVRLGLAADLHELHRLSPQFLREDVLVFWHDALHLDALFPVSILRESPSSPGQLTAHSLPPLCHPLESLA
ncbi:MAG TPA: hypothetical protein VGF67_21215 [Ktedonobacteraceae bacterium]|jgi:hypothetical protein